MLTQHAYIIMTDRLNSQYIEYRLWPKYSCEPETGCGLQDAHKSFGKQRTPRLVYILEQIFWNDLGNWIDKPLGAILN